MATQEIKWPCVRCTKDEFEQLIQRELSALGYIINSIWFNSDNMVVTNFDGIGGKVDSIKETFVNSVIHNRKLCTSIPEFIEEAKNIAYECGLGRKEEVVAEKETTTEQPEEPSTPTLSEARKQFRELTKLYSVEELSKPEPPRSWEEYLEQNPIEDTTELDKKMEALRKLVLLQNKWTAGVCGEYQYAIVLSFETGLYAVRAIEWYNRVLKFYTREMAEAFLDAHLDLIEEAGDLI